MRVLRIFFKSALLLFFVAIVVTTLAVISIIRNPIGQYARKLDENLVERYEQKRSPEEIIQRKQKLDALSKTGSCIGCDFSDRKDEENKDLYDAIKSAKNKGLSINLSESNLLFAKLDGIDLSGANLSQTILIGTHLKGANLTGAHFKGAILSGTQLQGARLKGADLTGTMLDRTQLSEADLTGAILHEAMIFWSNSADANMSNVDFTNAQIVNSLKGTTKFTGADFRGAKIYTTFSNNSDFTDAKFDNFVIRSFNTYTLWLLLIWEHIKFVIEYKKAQKAANPE